MYFDTAYIAKCYLQEPEGEAVRNLAATATRLYSCTWCIVEMASVVHRNLRAGTISEPESNTIRRQFSDDVRNGVWSLLPVTDQLLYQVDSFIAGLSASVFIRAGDAVHL